MTVRLSDFDERTRDVFLFAAGESKGVLDKAVGTLNYNIENYDKKDTGPSDLLKLILQVRACDAETYQMSYLGPDDLVKASEEQASDFSDIMQDYDTAFEVLGL